MEDLVQLILDYRYLILVPLAFIEGPIVSFVVGVLVAADVFNPFIAYAILVLGDVLPDTAAYLYGRYGNPKDLIARYGPKVGLGPDQFGKIRRLWYEHGVKTVLLSKVAYGLSTPLLISAGVVGLPWRRFAFLTLSVSLVQYAVLMALGYYFARSFGTVQFALETAGMIVSVMIVGGIIVYFVSRYFRARLLAAAAAENGGPDTP